MPTLSTRGEARGPIYLREKWKHVVWYAALNFSRNLDLDAVLAFSPQYSIDKAKVPWEKRWGSYASKLKFTNDDMVINNKCEVHIIYDPLIDDAKHVELIAKTGTVNLHRTRGGGHQVIEKISRAGLLKPLVVSFVDGKFDVSLIDAFNQEH